MAGLAPPSVPTLGANLLPTLCMSQTLALKLQETKPTLELGFKEQPLTFVPATLGIPPQTKLRMLVKLGHILPLPHSRFFQQPLPPLPIKAVNFPTLRHSNSAVPSGGHQESVGEKGTQAVRE